jgi:hypothetical protein
MDVLVGVFGFEEKHLSDNHVRNIVADCGPKENDPVPEQS